MTQRDPAGRCIEWVSFARSSTYFSVLEYQEGLRRARSIGTRRGLAFHELTWTQGAPTVEKLTVDWQETGEGEFRICDWEVYDTQMRELLGFA